MEHLFFDSIDEMRNQTGSHGPNYLRNHTAERDYFSPLSIVTSIQKPQEYLFSNYMDAWSFCVHTPNKHEFFHETYMHKHNFQLPFLYSPLFYLSNSSNDDSLSASNSSSTL